MIVMPLMLVFLLVGQVVAFKLPKLPKLPNAENIEGKCDIHSDPTHEKISGAMCTAAT